MIKFDETYRKSPHRYDDCDVTDAVVSCDRCVLTFNELVELSREEHSASRGGGDLALGTSVASCSSEQKEARKISGHKVTVVVPALNEAENLPHVLPCIPADVHEVILVDGNSTDDTVEVARKLWPSVRVIQQQGRGKGNALRSGFAAATGDIIVMLDADGSTNPSEIPLFVGALVSGADFVKGSRFLQGGGTADMPFYRKLGNWGFVFLVRTLFSGSYSDLCYGYNAFWRRVLPSLALDCDGFEVETMMNIRALRSGLKVAEVPSFEASRVYGEGRLQTFPDGWRVLKTIGKEWVNSHVRRKTEPSVAPSPEFAPVAVDASGQSARHILARAGRLT